MTMTINLRKFLNCISVVIVMLVAPSCVTMPAGPSISDISIGMTKDDVANIVGRGNAGLCRKRTMITENGQVEVWTLYIFQMLGAANWSWNQNGNSPVFVTFRNGYVISVEG
jgi:hypothetical protein